MISYTKEQNGQNLGKVQIIGLDYMRRSGHRTVHINEIMKTKCFPEDDTVLRIVMLHDPGNLFSFFCN